MNRRRYLTAALVLGACCCIWAASVRAQAPASKPTGTADPRGAPEPTFFELVHEGGKVGYTIIVLSVIGVSLAIEQLLTLRRKTLMPPGLAEKVRDLLRAGQAAQADQQCKLQPSPLAHVLSTGISELDGGWPVVEKAMEDAVAEEAARLYRKAEYLSVIGNIAPMLGLLGTVLGMIEAFSRVSAGTSHASELADGIYKALVTTVEGLVVAIPALGVFAIFRNRIDGLVAEMAYIAQHVFAPLRRGVVRRAVPVQSPPHPGSA